MTIYGVFNSLFLIVYKHQYTVVESLSQYYIATAQIEKIFLIRAIAVWF